MNIVSPDLQSSGTAAAELDRMMAAIGAKARFACSVLAATPSGEKDRALRAAAAAIRRDAEEILAANREDVAEASSAGASPAVIDRLTLTLDRVRSMANGLESISRVPDPVGQIAASWERPNGLKIERVRTPLGVIGVIYESRPNVTADAGALALKAGNPVILRGGSEAMRSSRAIHQRLLAGLAAAEIPDAAIQLVPTSDRAAVGMMLAGIGGAIDVIVPRGGRSLVARVQAEARVPVFAHLEGICHVYVHSAADPAMAEAILLNAKMRRTGVCGAAETLLVDRAIAPTMVPQLVTALQAFGCEVRGDKATATLAKSIVPATDEDWSTEYLDAIISVRVVDGIDAAMGHIDRYGSHHTDAIVTNDAAAAERFLREVDSAIVLHNASTQFADGGEFGFGGEIGIATGRIHARGPIGAEQLTTFKYRIHGTGQTRP